ncbi:DUF2442 domain-containing protein [Segnochrobactrum spirostomi]|uniref:DUF2442 domain-containing protein n=1 Tax=Segnochrobactrum spirostomi TaxID=2608987 RepID=A0A6A7Y022_9HYPH|nr:DUF2442 domain-containing protein [Segnochrobactrum spirostomi]MQT12420.1 DUF2442 domain-containing protein [Segnochrobactrum spirostomi]
MSEVSKIVAVDVVRHGVLQIRWDDGYTAPVDLKWIIARGGVYAFLKDPVAFSHVLTSRDGRSVLWSDPDGDIISIGADALRARAAAATAVDIAA